MQNSDNCQLHSLLCPRMRFIAPQKKGTQSFQWHVFPCSPIKSVFLKSSQCKKLPPPIFGSGTDPMSLLIWFFFLFLLGRRSSSSVVSNRIGIEFSRIVPRVYCWSRIFDITSHFQDYGHNVRPPLGLPTSPPSACKVIGSLYAQRATVLDP